MSLFDLIKYGDTPLNDSNALHALPSSIIRGYYEKLVRITPDSEVNHDYLCIRLALKHISYHKDRKYLLTKKFHQSLLEHDEPV